MQTHVDPVHLLTKAAVAGWVCGGGDGGQRAAPKVASRKQHFGLVARNALDVITPPPAADDSSGDGRCGRNSRVAKRLEAGGKKNAIEVWGRAWSS